MKRVAPLLIALAALSACGRESAPLPAPASRPDAAPGKVVNLYIWAEYIPPSVLDKFRERTGIKVQVSTFQSNEELLQKLQSGVADYDVCVASDYIYTVLIAQKLIQPLDPAKVPNLKNTDPRFLHRPFDPENRYCVPYLWGTTGLGYNQKRVQGPVDSWQVLFDEKNAGQILMLDDVRECFAVALKLMGKSLNTTDPDTLKAAADMLKKQFRLVKTYNSDNYDNILEGGDVAFAHGYNGQIAKKVAARPDEFAYVIPKEGATISMDAMCVPTKARNPAGAMAFINFVNEPEIAAEVVNGVNYASTNAAAKPFIKPAILNDPNVYPPEEALKNCEAMEDLGPARAIMDRYWTEIKAQ